MKGLKIFLAWILTVVIGSILLPIIPVAFARGDIGNDGVEFVLLFMLIGAMISAAASSPTIIVLLIVHAVNIEKKTRLRSVNIAHICMAMLTVIVGTLWIYTEFNGNQNVVFLLSGGVVTLYISVVVFYAVIAVLVWYFLFRKEYQQARLTTTTDNSQILDETGNQE